MQEKISRSAYTLNFLLHIMILADDLNIIASARGLWHCFLHHYEDHLLVYSIPFPLKKKGEKKRTYTYYYSIFWVSLGVAFRAAVEKNHFLKTTI